MERSVVTASSHSLKRSAATKQLMPYLPNATRNRPKHEARPSLSLASTTVLYRQLHAWRRCIWHSQMCASLASLCAPRLCQSGDPRPCTSGQLVVWHAQTENVVGTRFGIHPSIKTERYRGSSQARPLARSQPRPRSRRRCRRLLTCLT
jgi:hypothetical protein